MTALALMRHGVSVTTVGGMIFVDLFKGYITLPAIELTTIDKPA